MPRLKPESIARRMQIKELLVSQERYPNILELARSFNLPRRVIRNDFRAVSRELKKPVRELRKEPKPQKPKRAPTVIGENDKRRMEFLRLTGGTYSGIAKETGFLAGNVRNFLKAREKQVSQNRRKMLQTPLNNEQRRILSLWLMQGKPLEEIAGIIGTTPQNVNSLIKTIESRATASLKEKIRQRRLKAPAWKRG